MRINFQKIFCFLFYCFFLFCILSDCLVAILREWKAWTNCLELMSMPKQFGASSACLKNSPTHIKPSTPRFTSRDTLFFLRNCNGKTANCYCVWKTPQLRKNKKREVNTTWQTKLLLPQQLHRRQHHQNKQRLPIPDLMKMLPTISRIVDPILNKEHHP